MLVAINIIFSSQAYKFDILISLSSFRLSYNKKKEKFPLLIICAQNIEQNHENNPFSLSSSTTTRPMMFSCMIYIKTTLKSFMIQRDRKSICIIKYKCNPT